MCFPIAVLYVRPQSSGFNHCQMPIDLAIPDAQKWPKGKYPAVFLSLLYLDFTVMFIAACYFLSGLGGFTAM